MQVLQRRNAAIIAAILPIIAGTAVFADTSVVEEVIVTAEFREESIQDMSLSVTAVSGEALRDTGTMGLEEAVTTMPSVEERTGRGDGGFYIRGVGSRFAGINGAVSNYVDGVYQSRGNVSNFAAMDVSRIEVLRGPQGTLYGRGANGGAVNLITNDPVIGEFEGYVNVGFGDYSDQHLEGALNIPISDSVAIRVAAVLDSHDGYLDNDLDDADSKAARIKLLAQPTDNLSFLLSVEEFRNDANGYGNVFVPTDDWIGIPYEGVPFPFFAPACGNGTFPVGPPGGPTMPVTLPACDPNQDTDNTGIRAQVDYDAGPVAVTGIYGYQDYTSQYRQVFSGIFEEGFVPLEQQSLEVRLSSNTDGPVEWVAGVFWLEHDQSGSRTAGTFGTTQTDLNVNTTTAVFGQGTFNVADRLRLIAGLRYTDEEQESLVALAGVGLNEEVTETSKTTWKVGAEYDLAANSLLYGTVSTGFTRGGQGLSQLTGGLYFWDEETVTSYEIGTKNVLMDGALQLNGALYYYDWEDFQLNFPIGSPNAGNFETRTQNVDGSTSIFGIELEGTYLITDSTRLDFSATYNNSKFAEGEIFINGFFQNLSPPGAPPMLVPLDPIDMTDIDLPYAPRFTSTLRLSQELLEGLTLSVGLDHNDGYWTAIERFNNDGSLKDNFWQENYTIWNASLSYEPDGGQWSVSVYGKNLSEELVIGQSNQAGPNVVGVLQNPRTYGITASYRF